MEVFRVYMFTASSKTTDYKSVHMCSQLEHAHSVHTMCACTTECTAYDIHQKNSAIQLTSVGLAHAHPNDKLKKFLSQVKLSLLANWLYSGANSNNN